MLLQYPPLDMLQALRSRCIYGQCLDYVDVVASIAPEQAAAIHHNSNGNSTRELHSLIDLPRSSYSKQGNYCETIGRQMLTFCP